ncbi:MAG: NADH-quinone oxidoreductase subunit G, partial [Sulfuricella sp.]
FDYNSSEDVRAEILAAGVTSLHEACNNQLQSVVLGDAAVAAASGVQRIAEVPIYQADAVVRRADSLQCSHDGAAPDAVMNGALLRQLQVEDGAMVVVRQGSGSAVMRARRDDTLPLGCARVAAGHPQTAALGSMFGEIVVEKA